MIIHQKNDFSKLWDGLFMTKKQCNQLLMNVTESRFENAMREEVETFK